MPFPIDLIILCCLDPISRREIWEMRTNLLVKTQKEPWNIRVKKRDKSVNTTQEEILLIPVKMKKMLFTRLLSINLARAKLH